MGKLSNYINSRAEFARKKGSRDKKKRKRSLRDNLLGTTTAGRVARGVGAAAALGAGGVGAAMLLRRGSKGMYRKTGREIVDRITTVNRPSPSSYRLSAGKTPNALSPGRNALSPGRNAAPSGSKTRMIPGRNQTGAPPQVGDYMGGKRRTYKDVMMDGLRNMKQKVTRALPPGNKKGRGRPKRRFQA